MRVACAKAIAVILECGLDNDKISLSENLTKIVRNVSAMINVWNRQGRDVKTPWEVHNYLQVSLQLHFICKLVSFL